MMKNIVKTVLFFILSIGSLNASNYVPCGFNYQTGQMVMLPVYECEAYLNANAKAEQARAAAAASAEEKSEEQLAALHLPNGNFTQTCKNYSWAGSSLIAYCLNESGRIAATLLMNADTCQYVQNINGQLTCE